MRIRRISSATGQTIRFVPWGFNYDHDDAGRLLEDYWADDWAKVTNDFQEMKILGANVVRIHPQLCRFMKSPEQPDEKTSPVWASWCSWRKRPEFTWM